MVYPEKTVRSRVISPLPIAPQYRARYNSLIDEAEGSGSGVFLQSRRCLLGIISVKVRKYNYRMQNGRIVASDAGYAGYYIGAAAIAEIGLLAPWRKESQARLLPRIAIPVNFQQ